MGWTYTNKTKGKSVKSFFENEFNSDGRFKVLDCAVVNMRTAYLACEITKQDGSKYVGAIICLLNYDNNSYYNFGYKDIDETMGACESECPERILKLLSPVEEFTNDGDTRTWASEWRKRCWDNVEKQKNIKKIGLGTVIKFENPVRFTDGSAISLFVRIDSRKLRFACASVNDDSNIEGEYVRAYSYRQFILDKQTLKNAVVVGHIEL